MELSNSSTMMARVASCLAALLTIPGLDALADQSDVAGRVNELKAQVLSGYVAGRQKLNSGRFQFDHVLENDPPPDGVVTTASGERVVVKKSSSRSAGTYTFDGNGSFVRIDVKAIGADGRPLAEQMGGQFARTPKDSVISDVRANVVLIDFPKKAAPHWASCFDVRALGTAHAVGWDEISLSDVVELYKEQPARDVVVKDGLYRVRWMLQIPKSQLRFLRTIWFREAHDFTPERMELQEAIGPGDGVADMDVKWGPVVQSQVVSYEKRDEVWIPTTAEVYCHESFRRKLTFKWEWVNQKCDDSQFKWQGFDLMNVKSVIDFRPNPSQVLLQR